MSAPSRTSAAPKLVTNLDVAVGIRVWAIPTCVVLLLLLIAQSAAIWIVIACLEVLIWTAWWLRTGRYWHPLLELRWAATRPTVTGPDGSTSTPGSFQIAWERTQGQPLKRASAPGPTAPSDGSRSRHRELPR